MSKHTPGPWKVAPIQRGKYRGDIGIAPSGELDPVFCFLAKGRDDIQAANARLIAAAPELLASLIAMIGRNGPIPNYTIGEIQTARAIIAKAEGR
jgi:hypothetical protein